MPWAQKLYGCDTRWWQAHNGTQFVGEKWATHSESNNNNLTVADEYNLNVVKGVPGYTFSRTPNIIHHGDNSGFQAINLAVLLGSPYIVLVGFNMQHVGGKGHFFGEHPPGLHNQDDYTKWVRCFQQAADALEDVVIINATPQSAIDCWQKMTIEDALAHFSLHCYRAIGNA